MMGQGFGDALGAMILRRLVLGAIGLFLIFVITFATIATISGHQCHGECAHGDRHCQEKCLREGYCPEGN